MAPPSTKNVLICGGSGLIGRLLSELLRERGHNITILSRKHSSTNQSHWNPDRGYINPDALTRANVVINLAGAGIADQLWTAKRKAEILTSRVQSTRLIYTSLAASRKYPEVYIGASAIGYYGNRGEEIITEESPAGKGFLAHVATQWERETSAIETLGIRTVMLRMGMVLSRDGGALPKMALPIKLGLALPLGSGSQYVSWIHIYDICGMIIHAMEDKKWSGAYNAVSPMPVTNRELIKHLAGVLRRPFFKSSVPEFFIRLFLGDMSQVILEGARVSGEKAQKGGYQFLHSSIQSALADLFP